MSILALLFLIAGLGLIGGSSARVRAIGFGRGTARFRSLPGDFGQYVGVWTVIPAALFLLVWVALSPATERAAILSDARARIDWGGTSIVLLLAAAAGVLAYLRVRLAFQARRQVERVVMAALLGAAAVVVVTMLGIVVACLFEAWRITPPMLSALSTFRGMVLVGAIVGMIGAIPVALIGAVRLAHYAPPRVRRRIKPALEILSGVPTIVYGASLLMVMPETGIGALIAGLAMGVMILPFVAATADDALAAVPPAIRDGSLALGASLPDTIRDILLPAALPGIARGAGVAVTRTVCETLLLVAALTIDVGQLALPSVPRALLALAIMLPVGVLSALYIGTFAPRNRVIAVVGATIDGLVAVPPIMFGLLGLMMFSGTLYGAERIGVALALTMLPLVVGAARDAIERVPARLRDAALALGASPVQAAFQHILPLAMPRLATGIFVGLARALGQAVPLLVVGGHAFAGHGGAAMLVLFAILIALNGIALAPRRADAR